MLCSTLSVLTLLLSCGGQTESNANGGLALAGATIKAPGGTGGYRVGQVPPNSGSAGTSACMQADGPPCPDLGCTGPDAVVKFVKPTAQEVHACLGASTTWDARQATVTFDLPGNQVLSVTIPPPTSFPAEADLRGGSMGGAGGASGETGASLDQEVGGIIGFRTLCRLRSAAADSPSGTGVLRLTSFGQSSDTHGHLELSVPDCNEKTAGSTPYELRLTADF